MKRDNSINWKYQEPEKLDLSGVNVAVIGGTGGIGRAIAHQLASRGASVLVVGQTFRDSDKEGIEFIKADLSLVGEAQRVAHTLPAETLDIVLFTTGIFASPKREETEEGIERDLAVSYLSRYVILQEIAPKLGRPSVLPGVGTRVFIMGYPGTGKVGNVDDLNSDKSYGVMSAHMNTVAGNEVLVLDSKERYPGFKVYGLNPGLIKSNIRSNLTGAGTLKGRFVEWLIGLTSQNAVNYARLITPLLVSPDIEKHNGALFDKKGLAVLPSPGLTRDYVRRFMDASEALVSRAGF